jgi:hypothetical protein
MSESSEKQIIELVILDFYKRATTDIMIGYHFRKIQEYNLDEFKNHPLRPPIEAFSHHLPIINEFWYRQLKGESNDSTIQLNVLNKHLYLNIRKGELKRFQIIFKETLEKHYLELDQLRLFDLWKSKLDHFTEVFSNSKIFKKFNQSDS